MKILYKRCFYTLNFLTVFAYQSSFSASSSAFEDENMKQAINILQEQCKEVNPDKVKTEFEGSLSKFSELAYRELILLFGNTGEGKSALANILCGIKMVSCEGKLENTIDDTLNLGFRVSSDDESVTRFPEFRITESNQIFVDLPGFMDTRGVNSDLVNAALIKSLVERARVIKALVVLNAVQSERKQGTVQVLRATKFLGEELRDSSLLALVNKVSTDDYDAGEDFIDEFVKGKGAEFAYLRKLREASRLSLVPKLRRTETFVDFTAKWKDSVLEKIAGIRGTHVETAHVEWTLNAKSIGLIEKYFRYTFLDVLYKEMMDSWGKIASSVDHRSKDFESKRDDVKSSFHKRLEEDDRFCMIRDLVKGIYSDIETEQQGTFHGKFEQYIQYLKIQEKEEQVQIAKEKVRITEEQVRIAEEQEQIAKEQRRTDNIKYEKIMEQNRREAEALKRKREEAVEKTLRVRRAEREYEKRSDQEISWNCVIS